MSATAHRTKTVSITSGKGGVGKTTMTANIACALASMNKKVLILDGDLGMANVDIFFGVKTKNNIYDVISGEKHISEIITELSPNISLIAGGSGVVELNRLNFHHRQSLLDSVSSIDHAYDYLLIDTAPGLSDNVLYLNAAAQISSVIITPDPASFADSYALIKTLYTEYKETHFSIICNQVRDEIEGLSLFNRFNEVVNRFLFIGLDYWGAVAFDPSIKKNNQAQRLILKQDPYAEASKQIMSISSRLDRSLYRANNKSGLQFFWEQVVGVA